MLRVGDTPAKRNPNLTEIIDALTDRSILCAVLAHLRYENRPSFSRRSFEAVL
jgi:hypothetical protein